MLWYGSFSDHLCEFHRTGGVFAGEALNDTGAVLGAAVLAEQNIPSSRSISILKPTMPVIIVAIKSAGASAGEQGGERPASCAATSASR